MFIAAIAPSETNTVNAALVLLWLSIGLVLAMLLWPRRRGRTLARQLVALAVLGFQEGIRLRILWTVLAIALLCGGLAYFADADGTHAGRAKLILNTCLMAGELLGAALVVSLAALSVSRELESRIMHTIGAKPVPRWAILAGKALGFWAVQLCFVALLSGAIALLVRAVPLRAETRTSDTLIHSETWSDLERNALTTRMYSGPAIPAGEKSEYKFIAPGTEKVWQIAVPPADGSLHEQRSLRLVLSSTDTFAAQIPGVRVNVSDQGGTVLLERTGILAQGRPIEFVFDSPRAGALNLQVSVGATYKGQYAPKIIVAQSSGVRIGTKADGFAQNLIKASALLAIQGGMLSLIATAWSGVLSFSVSIALGVILLLGGELSRYVVEVLDSETQRLIQSGFETADREYQVRVVEQVKTVLSLLPDFHTSGGPTFFVEGKFLPWLAIAHAALWMGIVRGLGWALPGFVSFQRKEVGG